MSAATLEPAAQAAEDAEMQPLPVRGWIITYKTGARRFRWWCSRCRHWHTNGWGDGDDGLRCAPHCMRNEAREIQLIPLGRPDAAMRRRILADRPPPDEMDCGPVIVPRKAAAIARRELNRIAAAAGKDPDDEFLDSTISEVEAIGRFLRAWNHLHRKTLGAPRLRDIEAIAAEMR